MAYFIFFLLSIVCVAAVVFFLISKNPANNALLLILAFTCTGGLFGIMGASFIAVVQIIIYAGAIMILFVFVIMMINVREGIPAEKRKWTAYLSVAVALVFLAELFLTIRGTLQPAGTAAVEQVSDPTSLGRLLFTSYLYPFEITSVLIIAALVGALVLVKKKEES
ncbi:MAG: NADH-quinone oxidoreductase subunit J [Acidobacteria bacterium]|nr:NADH-quinone oxidoreductase subunit J [Acidobacteriota bacterium]MBU4254973.1 NADH-quinone oxidoreductase subunit J [Acidobacteriota bacterium]